MSRWKVAGQLAAIHHDREMQLQHKRLIKEQLEESKKNGTLLRSLARARNKVGIEARATLTITGRWHQTLVEENMRQTLEKQAATSVVYRRQDQRCKRLMLQRLQQMDDARSRAHAMKTAIEMVQVEERDTDEQIAVLKAKREARIREADKVHVPDPSRVARRVELAHQQYALQLARNRSLVQQVTHLEGERDKVLKVHQQLRNDLDNQSKELDAYIEESSTTYEQRDMNRRNIAKLKEHLARSTVSYNADMQLLQFKIDVLKHMEHFMLTKNKFRVDAGLQRQRERRNLPSLAERRRLNMLHELKMVRADLDQEDLSVMASTFIQLQQENHMLFHNVSHIRNSCDTLNLEVDALRQQTKELRTSKQKEAHELRARRAELVDKIQACSQEANRKEKEVTVVEQTIASYIQGVVNILHQLSYSEQDFTRLAGVFQRVGERNVRHFMAEIENNVNQLHLLQSVSEFLSSLRARKLSMAMCGMSTQTIKAAPPLQPTLPRVVVVPPQPQDDEDDEDDSALPMEAAYRPLDTLEMRAYVEDDLDTRELESESESSDDKKEDQKGEEDEGTEEEKSAKDKKEKEKMEEEFKKSRQRKKPAHPPGYQPASGPGGSHRHKCCRGTDIF